MTSCYKDNLHVVILISRPALYNIFQQDTNNRNSICSELSKSKNSMSSICQNDWFNIRVMPSNCKSSIHCTFENFYWKKRAGWTYRHIFTVIYLQANLVLSCVHRWKDSTISQRLFIPYSDGGLYLSEDCHGGGWFL